ncbi:MAG: hypothetical protein Q8P84_05215 [Deltaproteobacteria bacterium]|nr:hypothetical protein [Deltaproteobacteria bacterium]MDZ4224377.1 hypothetical protein [bacterium]
MILAEVAQRLGLTDVVLKKYPSPVLKGKWSCYKISLERALRKKSRFLAIIDLPQKIPFRIFIQSEKRKTSLKPIAELKLVTTGYNLFDAAFLLLAGEPAVAQAVFQPYLCGKILSQNLKDWQMDIHDREAHLDLRMESLEAKSIAELLKVLFEILNALHAAHSL